MLAVISHDAGAAEIISSYVRQQGINCLYVLDGPAKKIFTGKLGNINFTDLNDAIKQASSVLCGTSWPSRHEWEALGAARQAGVPSVAMLDHWVNYRRRFERDSVYNWPDVIWVVDAAAERIAAREFEGVPIKRIQNPYRLDIIEKFQALPKQVPHEGVSILYVTEPTSDAAMRMHGDSRFFGYTEDDALRGFLLSLSDWPDVREIVIRPHPTEREDKYRWASAYPRVSIDMRRSLLSQIAYADLVVGCNSMAMVVATWVGKRVLCAIPLGGRGFSLPVEGIEFLSEFVEKVYR